MFCSNCGSQNPDSSKFCQGCGTRLAVEQPQAPPPPTPPPPPPQQVSPPPPPPPQQVSAPPTPAGIICPNCRSQVSTGKAFCTSCGTQLGGPPRQQTMPPQMPPPIPPQMPQQAWGPQMGPQMGPQLVGAGVGRRAVAIIIDGIIISIICYTLVALFGTSSSSMGSSGLDASFNITGIGAVVFILFPIVYFVCLEATIGATIGKLAMGLKVVKTDGGKSTFGTAIIRYLLWIVDGLIFIPLVGMITIWVTKSNQRVGDLVAGTVVIRKNSAKARRGGSYNDDYGWDNSSSDSGYDYDSSSSSSSSDD